MVSPAWLRPEPARIAYERLREQVLLGEDVEPDRLSGFRELGLTGLLLGLPRQTCWQAAVQGARRPPWTPHQDPRQQALVNAFNFLLAALKEDCK